MATFTRPLYQSAGGEKIALIELVVTASVAYSASNYWTVTIWAKKPDQTYGKPIATFSTATRSLTANVPVAIFDDANGRELEDGEELTAVLASTGSPALLGNPTLRLTKQRKR